MKRINQLRKDNRASGMLESHTFSPAGCIMLRITFQRSIVRVQLTGGIAVSLDEASILLKQAETSAECNLNYKALRVQTFANAKISWKVFHGEKYMGPCCWRLLPQAHILRGGGSFS